MALEGKIDFVVKTNPFGSSDKPEQAPEKPDLKKAANDAKAAFAMWK